MSEVRTTFRLKPGDPAPDFIAPDCKGTVHPLSDLKGPKGTLIAFVCNHCPFVVHLAEKMASFANEIGSKDVNTVAIMPNDVAYYPQDSPDKMKEFAREYGWNFPYLHDESQDIALAYGAACTPDFFLLDATGLLFYTGQFDSTRPHQGRPDGRDLREAVELMLKGAEAPDKIYPSSGCNIKWKAGVKPSWWDSGNYRGVQ